MVNPLSEVRDDICLVLSDAGIKSISYQENRYTPPVALVVPSETDYVTMRQGDRFGHLNVSVQVLLIGPKAGAKNSIEAFDNMILTAIKALGDEFDLTSVQAPGEAVVNGINYNALIITVETQININEFQEGTE